MDWDVDRHDDAAIIMTPLSLAVNDTMRHKDLGDWIAVAAPSQA